MGQPLKSFIIIGVNFKKQISSHLVTDWEPFVDSYWERLRIQLANKLWTELNMTSFVLELSNQLGIQAFKGVE